jgi:hypothetical protein
MKIPNKGSLAGGANTNLYGKLFEERTSNIARLIDQGFVRNEMGKGKYDFCLSKTNDMGTVSFVTQNGLKTFMKNRHGVELFRCPDEAYILEYKRRKHIKVLEKKEQHVEGSVETKLWSGPTLKREYELMLGGFDVEYAFCLNNFLKMKLTSNDKKYSILNSILCENGIKLFYGEDKTYFNKLDTWIGAMF